ncbi:MAG: hypothetical protein US52_C0011G0004 [candidate division WS6 bacterium GW2011_GWA2_37_6]|uniref:Uncharacterized protein n=1 Tax=candidate division WS6 bacterium GW2011_GWA2_37_6 TaxID=1619087 RepID=A0A0G0HBV0_9BACT|nr:MAG: hypothetical protein US52_C0011G0004 [candidate division WS6 bacterium GW2011_GWA2_37_6]
MQTKHFLFFYKKSINFFSEVLLSVVVALVAYFLFIFFQAPIEDQLNIGTQTFSSNYSVKNNNSGSAILSVSANADSNAKTVQSVELSYTSYDYRARVFDLYFKKNNSPLYGHGQAFAAACDRYSTPHDCTLLPAIAKVETDLCKTAGSAAQFNCWGYGGSAENRIVYKNFDQAADDITKRLMAGYSAKFFTDPEYGELTYCGPHCSQWGDHVKTVQNDLKQFAKQNGYSL